MDFLSFHFTLAHEWGGISLKISPQEHHRISAFFYVYQLLHYFGQSEKFWGLNSQDAYAGVHHRENSWSSSFVFGGITAQCRYSAQCVGTTRWASRVLQLGGVESRLLDIWFNISIISKHKFQPTCCKKITDKGINANLLCFLLSLKHISL